MIELPPLSLYVHIPWCVQKCPYCDFNSHAISDLIEDAATNGDHKATHPGIPETDYTQSLICDLGNDLDYVQNRVLGSIFFGGGTPSLFSPKSIALVLDAAEQFIGFDRDIEITLEANPGTADSNYFEGYRNAGVNRLSIGIQSFDDKHLKSLGRIHSSEQARHAVALAHQAGFDNINIDLMYGLPGQTITEAKADLVDAIALRPTHLSWYQLTIEPNTEFYKTPPVLPVEQKIEEIQNYGHTLLSAEGLERYEVSAYAQPGYTSRHNTNYWRFGDYIGIGAGAHGKITMLEQQHIIRTRKTRRPAGYLAREDHYLADTNILSAEELPLEFMMNALRLNKGVPRSHFEKRTGIEFSEIAELWRELQLQRLLKAPLVQLVTTDRGYRFLDTILSKF